MGMRISVRLLITLILFTVNMPVTVCPAEPLLYPTPDPQGRERALRFQKTASTVLAPVYAPLSEWIVDRLDLEEKKGIGIDLGSGPGNLIVELCRRTTSLHWVNADINPYFFPLFFEAVEKEELGHRVSAIFADAKALPFKDNYADIVVSRGSFPFWSDKRTAFGEIYRVLKPGGIAFIGRGFPENLPVETARTIRNKQGRKKKSVLNYKANEAANELEEIMEELGIKNARVLVPKPPGSEGINYGLWVEFHKPGN